MRIILNIEEGIDPREAIRCTESIIASGIISDNGKSLCSCIVFRNGTTVYTYQTRNGTDVFNLSKGEQ